VRVCRCVRVGGCAGVCVWAGVQVCACGRVCRCVRVGGCAGVRVWAGMCVWAAHERLAVVPQEVEAAHGLPHGIPRSIPPRHVLTCNKPRCNEAYAPPGGTRAQ
jgi:hypothetical protein